MKNIFNRKNVQCHIGRYSLLILFLSFLYYAYATPTTFAQNVDQSSQSTSQTLSDSQTAAINDLQKKIDERNQNIAQLNQEIAQYQALADKTSSQAQSLQKLIQQLTANGKALDLDIKKTKAQIDATSLDINRLGLVIDKSASTIDKYKQAISHTLAQADEQEHTGIIATILAQKDLSGTLTQIDSMYQFTNQLHDLNVKLSAEKKAYEDSKQSKETQKQTLVKLQSDLADKKKVVDYNKSEQAKVLSETKNQQKTYEAIVADKRAKEAQFEQDLFNYQSQLKYVSDPSKLPQSGSSPLQWPVSNVIITQYFGKTGASGRLYVSGTHNGVDFGAHIGTPVLSLGEGVVDGSGDTDVTCPRASFGRWVLIKYNNGLASTYGHLSVIKASKGQVVHTGDIIGYSGNTGYSTGPHVHISMYAANAVTVQSLPSASCKGKIYTMPIAANNGYLDPMLYFPPYNK